MEGQTNVGHGTHMHWRHLCGLNVGNACWYDVSAMYRYCAWAVCGSFVGTPKCDNNIWKDNNIFKYALYTKYEENCYVADTFLIYILYNLHKIGQWLIT